MLEVFGQFFPKNSPMLWLLDKHPFLLVFSAIALGLYLISFNEQLRSGKKTLSTGKANVMVIAVLGFAIWLLSK